MIERVVAEAARALDLTGRRVLVAVSGGVDSTVLLDLLAAQSERLGLSVAAGHVNHGLRGAASEADERAVRTLAGALRVPVAVARVEPGSLRRGCSSRARPTLQEAARRARYDALEKLAAEAGAERIATAHTLDDQAETVLLRLLRGSGPDGLGGIPERSPDGRVVRPLLGVTRAQIERHARGRGLSWCEDASNRDPRYARGRLRRGGLAALAAEMNPRWLRAVGDLAEAQRRDAEWIDGSVDEAERGLVREGPDGLELAATGWEALAEPLARRLVRRVLHRSGAGRDVSRTHLLRVLAFLRGARPGRRIELPGGLELARERRGYRLRRRGVQPAGEC